MSRIVLILSRASLYSISMIVLAIAAAGAAAEEKYPGMKKYRDYTPQQIAELSEEEQDEVPMRYLFATGTGNSDGAETFFAMQLNTLMYPGVHDYDAAVKQFQRDLGDNPNGVLTVFQISELQQRWEMQKLARVFFPSDLASWISESYAQVTGTFVILDDRIAYPINFAKVECYKGDGYCEVNQMYLNIPDEDSFSQNFAVHSFDPEFFYISRWTENSIDAEPKQNPAACRTTTMNLNFDTKEFYQITRNTGKECEVMGQVMPPLERPRVSQIIDGEEIFNEEFGKIEQAAFDVLASDFRAKIEELVEKAKEAAAE